MKKRWTTLVVVVLLITVSTISTAVILADDGNAKPGGVGKLSTRVAEILGLDVHVVDSAISQAGKELRDKSIQNRMNALVGDGTFTLEEVEKHMREIHSSPHGIGPMKNRHNMTWKGHEKPSLEAIQHKLDGEVRDGKMTREEADETLKWYEDKKAIWTRSPWKRYHKPSLQTIQKKLDGEVRDGEMTREEAAEILKWYEEKKAIGTRSP